MTKFNASQDMKRGLLCFFNATQPYLNNNMCVIQYHNMDHNNVTRQTWHGVAMKGSIMQWVLGYW
jgi:hypothetical protein